VVWEKLDRLVDVAESDDEAAHRAFMEAADRVGKHLSMVFGEFLVGTNSVTMEIGNITLKRWDPFLRDHAATQVLPAETLSCGLYGAVIQPYVLPHHSKLTKTEFESASGPKGWNSHQGFYIYRNRRLISAGGWLSLGLTRDEHLKLARIRIDLGNDVDFEWKLDVRKSVASPPRGLRQELRRIARLTRERAQEVYRHRGRRIVAASPEDHSSIWEARLMRGKNTLPNQPRTPGRTSTHRRRRERTRDRGTSQAGRADDPLASIYIRHAEAPDEQPTPFDDTKDRQFSDMLSDLYLSLRSGGRGHQQAIACLSALSAATDAAAPLGSTRFRASHHWRTRLMTSRQSR
jgi:hypothetical protein